MRITAIKAQIKQAGRYSIFVDEKYSFSLGANALLDERLITGQELTPESLATLKQLSSDDKVYAQVLNYLALRPRSSYEVSQYMKRKKASPELITAIVQKLIDQELINDESFAQSWVESRRLLKPISKRKLMMELRQKGISDESATAALAADETNELTVIKDLIGRKRRQSKYQDDDKLMQYLARQGFQYDDIKQALVADQA